MANPGARKGDLMCWRRRPDGPWAIGIVTGVGQTIAVKELGKRAEEEPAFGDRLLICRTITDLPELRRRYKARTEPLATREDVRAFVIDHVPPEVAGRT